MPESIAGAALLLPPSLDITWAESLQAELLRVLGQEGDVTIDGGAVERVCTPCIQLLAAAAASARGQSRTFRMTAPSPLLETAIRDLGLDAALAMEAA